MAKKSAVVKKYEDTVRQYRDNLSKLQETESQRARLLEQVPSVNIDSLREIGAQLVSLEDNLTGINADIDKLVEEVNDKVNLGQDKEWLNSPKYKEIQSKLTKLHTDKQNLEKKYSEVEKQRLSMKKELEIQQKKNLRLFQQEHKEEFKIYDDLIKKYQTAIKESDQEMKQMIEQFNIIRSRAKSSSNNNIYKQSKDELAELRRISNSIRNNLVNRLTVPKTSLTPATKTFKVGSRKKVLSGSSLKPMEIIPLKVDLKTPVIKDKNGNLTRAHNYEHLDAKAAKRFGKTPIRSVTDLSKALGEYFFKGDSGATEATRFGNAHHRILEAFYKKEKFSLGDGKYLTLERNKDGTFNQKDIEDAFLSLWRSKNPENMDDASYVMGRGGKLNPERIANIARTTSEYIKLAKAAGIPDNAAAEKPYGVALKTAKGRQMVVAGTLDQIWLMANNIFGQGDAKTSEGVGPIYGFQASMNALIQKAFGRESGGASTIIHTPREGGINGEAVKIDILPDEFMADILDDIYDLEHTKSIPRQKKLQRQLMQK